MLKFPNPIEQDLDRVRDKIWEEAGKNYARLHSNIRKNAQATLNKYGYQVATKKGTLEKA